MALPITLRLDPTFGKAQAVLAVALKLQGNVTDATTEARKALLLDPDNVEMHLFLGDLLLRQGQVEQALSEYREALCLDPHDAKTRKGSRKASAARTEERPLAADRRAPDRETQMVENRPRPFRLDLRLLPYFAMAAISVRNLKKVYKVHRKPQGLYASIKALFRRRYKHVHAVDGISFDIDPGEMVGFLGPNGAGKTTSLKMLSGLIYPTEGTARVLDFIPWERKNAYRRQFALLMGQKNQLWWDLPAAESFRLHKEIYALEDRQFERVQGELTELLNVRDLLNQPVRELSLGERMKMELIAALLHSPRILFLDEPTIGLDVVAQASIRRCLREYNRAKKVTVLLTSHYMQDIEALCDRVLVINHGRLIHDGPLSDIVSRYANYKILTLRFADGRMPERFDDVGEVQSIDPPKVTLRLPRESVAREVGRLLAGYDISDISVEEPPIEDVISQMFSEATADDAMTAKPEGAPHA